MRGITIPEGYISVRTFPLHTQGDAYRTSCDDFDVNLFIKPPKGLEPYFERASENWGKVPAGDKIYTPCVVGLRTHQEISYHNATLLAPPNTKKDSELFVPGLVVPSLRIVRAVESEGRVNGYIMTSDYSGSQEFFASVNERLRTLGLMPDVEFQGLLIDAHKGEKRKRPFIRIETNSRDDPGVFSQNREMLQGLERAMAAREKFWWGIELGQAGDIELGQADLGQACHDEPGLPEL